MPTTGSTSGATDIALGDIARALLGLFAMVDDVLTEPDAFENTRTGMGRIYREWKAARAILDPEFNPDHFKIHKSIPMTKWVFQNLTAGDSKKSSSVPTKTSGLNRLTNGLRELSRRNGCA